MPYTNPLVSTAPADTDLLSNGDDSIRVLAAALIERLSTVFTDLDANPLVIVNSAKLAPAGSVTKAMVDATSFTPLKRLSGSDSFAATVAANSVTSSTIGVVGAAIGDLVTIGATTALGFLTLNAYVSAADTVRYTVVNPTAAPVTTSFTILVAIVKPA